MLGAGKLVRRAQPSGEARYLALVRARWGGTPTAIRLPRDLDPLQGTGQEGRRDGWQDVFSFMTTAPNALVGSINHERMPVLLSTETEFTTWLEGKPDEARTLLTQYPSERMRIVQSGYDKLDHLET